MATNRDSKKQTQHGHQSKYYRWMINKQKIGSFVKQQAKKEIYKNNRGQPGAPGSKTKGIHKQGGVKKKEESG